MFISCRTLCSGRERGEGEVLLTPAMLVVELVFPGMLAKNSEEVSNCRGTDFHCILQL